MIGWLLAGVAGLAILGKVSDNTNAENNSFQKSAKVNNYNQYVTLQLVAMPEYEIHIFVDDLLFCRTHAERPHSYIVNDIPVGCKLTEYRKYVGRYELAKCSECIVKPGSGVEVYTNKRGNRYFDRGLWVNDDGYGNC